MEDDADVRHEGLNSMLFRSNTATPCSGYVPRPGGEMCLQCEQPDDCHVLKHDCQRCDTVSEMQFMRVACRVGSMGWDSHPLMQLVHGVKHLGSNVAESGVVSGFLESTVALSQLSYRQHLHQHIFGANPAPRDFVPCQICANKSLALDSLPQVVRDEVERLQRERREEFQGFIGAIDGHFAPKSPPANTDGSVPAESIARPQTQLQQQQGTESVPSSASTLPAPVPSSPAPACWTAPHPSAQSNQMVSVSSDDPALLPDSDDAAAVSCLVHVLVRAGGFPAAKRREFATKLFEQGVFNELSLWRSLSANPPDFDLVTDIGMTAAQKRSLLAFLEGLKL
jgi:hypothetical protein